MKNPIAFVGLVVFVCCFLFVKFLKVKGVTHGLIESCNNTSAKIDGGQKFHIFDLIQNKDSCRT